MVDDELAAAGEEIRELGALKRVALRDDPPPLALRGVVIAQLGETGKAKKLLARAANAFGPKESVARARCVVAAAEVALASRELSAVDGALEAAVIALDARGDRANALHGRLVAIRKSLLLGRVERAAAARDTLELRGAPARLAAIAKLAAAEVAVRRLRPGDAREAYETALVAAVRAGIPALTAEIERACAAAPGAGGAPPRRARTARDRARRGRGGARVRGPRRRRLPPHRHRRNQPRPPRHPSGPLRIKRPRRA